MFVTDRDCKAGSKFKLSLTKYNEPTVIRKQRLEQEISNLTKAKTELMDRMKVDKSDELKQELNKINNKIITLNTAIANFDNTSINTLNTNSINTVNASINNLEELLNGNKEFNSKLADDIAQILNFNKTTDDVLKPEYLTEIVENVVKKHQNISKTDVDNINNMLKKNVNETFNATQALNQLKETLDSMSDSTSDAILEELKQKLSDVIDINNYKELLLNTFGLDRIAKSEEELSKAIIKIRLVFDILLRLEHLKDYRFATDVSDDFSSRFGLLWKRVKTCLEKLHEIFKLEPYVNGGYISSESFEASQMLNNIKDIINQTDVNELQELIFVLTSIIDTIKVNKKNTDRYVRKSKEPFTVKQVEPEQVNPQVNIPKSSGLNISDDYNQNMLYTLYRIEDILNRLLVNINFNQLESKNNSSLAGKFNLDKYHELVKNNNKSIVAFRECFKSTE